jgi:hypothetical protein
MAGVCVLLVGTAAPSGSELGAAVTSPSHPAFPESATFVGLASVIRDKLG